MEPRPAREPLPHWAVAALGFVALLLAVALVWHASAGWQVFRSRDMSASLSARLSAAGTARAMEPWNPTTRAVYGYVRSQQLFSQGRHRQAVAIMAEAYREAVSDTEMLAYFKHIRDVLSLETDRKAHLQQGQEDPGGAPEPSGIER